MKTFVVNAFGAILATVIAFFVGSLLLGPLNWIVGFAGISLFEKVNGVATNRPTDAGLMIILIPTTLMFVIGMICAFLETIREKSFQKYLERESLKESLKTEIIAELTNKPSQDDRENASP